MPASVLRSWWYVFWRTRWNADMARKERDTAPAKGRGATPRKGEKKPRATKWWQGVSRSTFGVLKAVRWKPVFATMAVVLIVSSVTLFWDIAVSKVDQEIVSIEVRGKLNYLSEGVLKQQLDRHLGEGFLSLDLNAVKDEVEAMPWVYSASLQRLWPGTLRIYIREQHPVAVWNEDSFLNAYGEVFHPAEMVAIEGVPALFGPTERAKEILRRYVSYRDYLSSSTAKLVALSLEPRGAWRLTLQNGVVLKLGRDPVEEKINRFIEVYQRGLDQKTDEIESIDARYTNGIAVRWKDKQEDDREKTSGSI